MILYGELLEEFKNWVTTADKPQTLWELNNQGKATYKTANAYADVVSNEWSKLLNDAYKDADLIEVSDDIAQAYLKTYGESAYFSKEVQKSINKSLGFNINALEPAVDIDRIKNLIGRIDDGKALFLLDAYSLNSIARAGVADTVQANARIQSDAGIHAYVVRDTGSGCCDWCESIAGRYEYGSQPANFWAVHSNCTCTIEYRPSRNRVDMMRYNPNQRRFTT